MYRWRAEEVVCVDLGKRIRDLLVLRWFHRRDFRHVELGTLAMFAKACEMLKEAVFRMKLHMAAQAMRSVNTQSEWVVIVMFFDIVRRKLHLCGE